MFCCVRTLPQGLPDPPVDVQVDRGPDQQTLTVMWLPVTITQFGLSNGAPVTGYVRPSQYGLDTEY